MDDLDIPTLNRKPRKSETREASARRKPWAPPSKLDAPPAPPGYKHRWIRAEAGGINDTTNVGQRLREGYELVRADEYPEFASPAVEGSTHAGTIRVGSLLLARMPEETIKERNAYYASRTRDQIRAVDTELLKSNSHDSMRIQAPSRRSKVVFGSPAISDDE